MYVFYYICVSIDPTYTAEQEMDAHSFANALMQAWMSKSELPLIWNSTPVSKSLWDEASVEINAFLRTVGLQNRFSILYPGEIPLECLSVPQSSCIPPLQEIMSAERLRTDIANAADIRAKLPVRTSLGGEPEGFGLDENSAADAAVHGKQCPWYPEQCLVLLRQLNKDLPFSVGHGKKREAWTAVADECLRHPAFAGVQVFTWAHAKRKWKSISDKHRKDAAAAPFRSGSVEECDEATSIIEELIAVEDDIDIESIEAKDEKSKDQTQKEIVGRLVESVSTSGLVRTGNKNKRNQSDSLQRQRIAKSKQRKSNTSVVHNKGIMLTGCQISELSNNENAVPKDSTAPNSSGLQTSEAHKGLMSSNWEDEFTSFMRRQMDVQKQRIALDERKIAIEEERERRMTEQHEMMMKLVSTLHEKKGELKACYNCAPKYSSRLGGRHLK